MRVIPLENLPISDSDMRHHFFVAEERNKDVYNFEIDKKRYAITKRENGDFAISEATEITYPQKENQMASEIK